MRVLHFLIPVRYGYLTVFLFLIPFGFIYHARIFILTQNCPSINMVRIVLTLMVSGTLLVSLIMLSLWCQLLTLTERSLHDYIDFLI